MGSAPEYGFGFDCGERLTADIGHQEQSPGAPFFA